MSKMRALTLVKFAQAVQEAYEIRDVAVPEPSDAELLIKVEAFGLNFADIMARKGIYPNCPELPTVFGYEVMGHVDAVGKDVTGFKVGDRVVGVTKYNANAEYAVAEEASTVAVDEDTSPSAGLSLAVQGTCALYCTEIAVNIQAGDHVLVQAAAGGVGAAIAQVTKHKGAIVYGTASSGKMDYLKSIGVDHAIDYTKVDFAEAIKEIHPEGMDIVFDSVGGTTFRKGYESLCTGGRIVSYGVASMPSFADDSEMEQYAEEFGVYNPLEMMDEGYGVVTVEMLRVLKYKPRTYQHLMQRGAELQRQGVLKPAEGDLYPISKLAEAHARLDGGGAIGKVAVFWD